jgi:hypothetical protein
LFRKRSKRTKGKKIGGKNRRELVMGSDRWLKKEENTDKKKIADKLEMENKRRNANELSITPARHTEEWKYSSTLLNFGLLWRVGQRIIIATENRKNGFSLMAQVSKS